MTLLHAIPRTKNRLRREVSERLARRVIRMRNKEPIISFTFDDFPRSALTTGGNILCAHGSKGTFFASFGLMGQVCPTGEIFSQGDLLEFEKQGHELGCHTFDHCHSWETAPDQFEQSILRNRAALKEYFPERTFISFSYPISGPRFRTKLRTGKYFECCRGGGQDLNVQEADLNYLNAFFIEQSRETPMAIRKLIERNARETGWLIFATHDISDCPTRFGCTPMLFENIVRWSSESGARVLPISGAIREVHPGGN